MIKDNRAGIKTQPRKIIIRKLTDWRRERETFNVNK